MFFRCKNTSESSQKRLENSLLRPRFPISYLYGRSCKTAGLLKCGALIPLCCQCGALWPDFVFLHFLSQMCGALLLEVRRTKGYSSFSLQKYKPNTSLIARDRLSPLNASFSNILTQLTSHKPEIIISFD